jgi:TM2 domain-containing membrane protein YozV/ribosomal protein L40E
MTIQADARGVDQKYCQDCAAVISSRAEICPKCGVRQPGVVVANGKAVGKKSKIAAGLFALLLGGIGVHKFYLGRAGVGILYLLFCWTFIPAIIALVEGIIYLTMSDENFAEKYG